MRDLRQFERDPWHPYCWTLTMARKMLLTSLLLCERHVPWDNKLLSHGKPEERLYICWRFGLTQVSFRFGPSLIIYVQIVHILYTIDKLPSHGKPEEGPCWRFGLTQVSFRFGPSLIYIVQCTPSISCYLTANRKRGYMLKVWTNTSQL